MLLATTFLRGWYGDMPGEALFGGLPLLGLRPRDEGAERGDLY